MFAGRAVLFDVGDTLVELGEGRGAYEARLMARVARVYDVLAAAGVVLPTREAFCRLLAEDSEAQYHAALAEQRGISIFEVVRRFAERLGIPLEDGLIEAAGAAYCTGGRPVPSPLRPGAIEVLQALRSWGLQLGAISNTVQPGRFMRPAMVERGLADFFAVQLYSADVGVAKPHPAIFRMALDALGVAPADAVYVGDRLIPDVAGPHAVGMKAVLIEVPDRVEHHPEVVPDARIRELPELLDVLPRLFT
ncbi:MAG: HAD family hydrolase [Anaerolineae bacterium]